MSFFFFFVSWVGDAYWCKGRTWWSRQNCGGVIRGVVEVSREVLSWLKLCGLIWVRAHWSRKFVFFLGLLLIRFIEELVGF